MRAETNIDIRDVGWGAAGSDKIGKNIISIGSSQHN